MLMYECYAIAIELIEKKTKSPVQPPSISKRN